MADERGPPAGAVLGAIAAGSGVQIEPFDSVEQAANWLGLPCGYAALEQVTGPSVVG